MHFLIRMNHLEKQRKYLFKLLFLGVMPRNIADSPQINKKGVSSKYCACIFGNKYFCLGFLIRDGVRTMGPKTSS